MVKIIISSFSVAVLLLLFFIVGSVVNNNIGIDAPSKAELEKSLSRSILWVKDNKLSLLKVPNYILWYRVKRVADLTHDQELLAIYLEFEKKYLGTYTQKVDNRVWLPLVYESRRSLIGPGEIQGFPSYLQHWIYGLHCSEALSEIDVIKKQHKGDFCGAYLINPTCTAHQMSGVLFIEKNQCKVDFDLPSLKSELQNHLRDLLVYDFRLVDIYFQRALKLIESGSSDTLKGRWLERIVNAQQPDGGWANFDPVVYIGDGRYIGYGHASSRTGKPGGDKSWLKGVSVGEVHSTFHATVQSMMLIALLLEE
ncbi:hypothetical protein OAV62_00600 [bacterium]|nr:hypothetical protein [bacterium]